jgi:hypothetical protein
MKLLVRLWALAILIATSILLGSCGGGGGTGATASATPSASSNIQAVTVNGGVAGQVPNMVLTSVTICVPGTIVCQTIPNVQVDTGSSGLRLLASAVTISLPHTTSASTGNVYGECASFADGVVWGTVAQADVVLAGEKASSVPLQVITDNSAGPTIPASCSAQGAPQDSLALLGANGILGIGLFLQDCGPFCVSNNAATYYDCTIANSCADTTVPLALQVSNPAASFAQDNNGVVLQLPAIARNGAPSVQGNLIFGIGTQPNNALAGTVIGVPDTGSTAGDFSATYNGVSIPFGFFDTGSTALYFDDTGIPICASSSIAFGFYCPGSAAALSELPINVTITGSNGGSASVNVAVANAEFLFTQPGAANLNVFPNLGAPAGASLGNSFDFGVPFFFGRSVFTAFEQRGGPNGVGPYFAFLP